MQSIARNIQCLVERSLNELPRVDTKGKIDNAMRKKQDPPKYPSPLGLRVLAAMIQ